jgi:hypothetical protein
VTSDRLSSSVAVFYPLKRDAAGNAVTGGGTTPAPGGPIVSGGAGTFVGRQAEQHALREAFELAAAGSGRLVMLVGDAGIGKTRLADEFAAHAGARGARVAWGRCWESGGAPAFWPWVQILRTCLAVGDALPDGAAAELINDLVRGGRDTGPIAADTDPEQARFRLFDATTLMLAAAAARQPLVVVLDDLHAADQSSLLLLRFVARELRGRRLLLLGTYRELEASRDPTRRGLLGEVVREGQRLALRGLTRGARARNPPPPSARASASPSASPPPSSASPATRPHWRAICRPGSERGPSAPTRPIRMRRSCGSCEREAWPVASGRWPVEDAGCFWPLATGHWPRPFLTASRTPRSHRRR